MNDNLNKLQIRALILTVLSELKTMKTLNQQIFIENISPLKEITDKDVLFNILIKELNKPQDTYTTLVKATIVESIPAEILKEKTLNILASPKITDQIKYHLLQVLKEIGTSINYDEFFEYFDDPETVLDYDTKKLLEFAIINPETQIDFMDFLTSLPEPDKFTLINSLNEDYEGDNLANILSPILYAEFSEDIKKRTIEILGETRSSIAFIPIQWVYENSTSNELKSLAKKNLNMLKLTGASEEKATNFFKLVLNESKIHDCYSTIPDGHGNQGIIISRKRDNDTYQIAAIVINHSFGIVDCFGFNILSENEVNRIVSRFCQSDPKIKVSPQYCKNIVNNAFNTTKIFREKFSYEFICWSILLKDIEEMPTSIGEWTKANLPTMELTDEITKEFFSKYYLDKWFFTTEDDEFFDALIDELSNKDSLNLEIIEAEIKNFYDKIWNYFQVQKLNTKIEHTCYLLQQLGNNEDARILYTIKNDSRLRDKLQYDMIKKSIYEYFATIKQNSKEILFSTNIFKLKNRQTNEKFKMQTVEKIINEIENNWVEE